MKQAARFGAISFGVVFCFLSHTLFAQVVISDGQNKIEVNGKTTKIKSGKKTSSGSKSNTITITGNGNGNEVYDANGKTVFVSGNSHKIRLTGNAAKIVVSGNTNVVTADGASQIDASGNTNKVIYNNLVNGKKPAISITGHDNSVKKAGE